VQDKIQSFQWGKTGNTTTFCGILYELSNGTFLHKNICVMSDTRDHTTITADAFLWVIISFLRLNFLS